MRYRTNSKYREEFLGSIGQILGEDRGVKMYKVVDHFNGWESDNRHETMTQARKEIEENRDAFFEVNPGCKFCQGIVEATAVWYFSAHGWVWG
jgi:hypothetical protein